MTKKAYWLDYDDDEYSEYYMPILKGPDDFACMLGEPEDSSWARDGSEAVDRLNEQHAVIETLLTENRQLKKVVDAVREMTWHPKQVRDSKTQALGRALKELDRVQVGQRTSEYERGPADGAGGKEDWG